MIINIRKFPFTGKLLAMPIYAGKNKMAQTIDAKPVHKNTVSWFEFLFDTTGDLLKKHLGDVSAGRLHLILLFSSFKHKILTGKKCCHLTRRLVH